MVFEWCSEDEEEKVPIPVKPKKRVSIKEPPAIDRHHAKHHVTKIPYKELSMGEFVGRGTFGVVYQGRWNDRLVAVKSIGESTIKHIPKEVMLLSKVQHKNIIDFYGYSDRSHHIFLVMEYADCGSLYDLIHRNHPDYGPVQYTPAHVMNWALQTAEAVEYLHNIKPRAIIHRDLKPSNILLTSDCEIIKICDFGEARTVHSDMTNCIGTPLWMAPEVIEGTKYTEKCDVYSFGIILWEMLARKKPFYDLEVEGQGIFLAVYKGLRPLQVENIPRSFNILITSCWDKYAKDRPSFTELVHFLGLAFKCVYEGDEELFDFIEEEEKDTWEMWSNDIIELQTDHEDDVIAITDEQRTVVPTITINSVGQLSSVPDRKLRQLLKGSPPQTKNKNSKLKEKNDSKITFSIFEGRQWIAPLLFLGASFILFKLSRRQ